MPLAAHGSSMGSQPKSPAGGVQLCINFAEHVRYCAHLSESGCNNARSNQRVDPHGPLAAGADLERAVGEVPAVDEQLDRIVAALVELDDAARR